MKEFLELLKTILTLPPNTKEEIKTFFNSRRGKIVLTMIFMVISGAVFFILSRQTSEVLCKIAIAIVIAIGSGLIGGLLIIVLSRFTQKFIFNLLALLVLFGAVLALALIPKVNHFFTDICSTPTITPAPTYTVSPSPSEFPTSTPPPTAINHITSTQTQTLTTISTKTSTPSPTNTITTTPTQQCALGGYSLWADYPEIVPRDDIGCFDFKEWGFAVTDGSVQIFSQPTADASHFGIYTNVPNDVEEIRFTIRINDIKAGNSEDSTDLYFGFFNPETNEPSGQFIDFLLARIDPEIYIAFRPNLLPSSIPFLKENPQKDVSYEIVLEIDKLTYDIYIKNIADNHRLDPILDIPIKSDLNSFWIGYRVPNGGKLKAIVSIPELISNQQ